jgi:secreted Zn-dependent insulinase-like peptidase
VIIMSQAHGPEHLLTRTEAFLQQYRAQLATMSEADFEDNR